MADLTSVLNRYRAELRKTETSQRKVHERFLRRAHLRGLWENWSDHRGNRDPIQVVFWKGWSARIINITPAGNIEQHFQVLDVSPRRGIRDEQADAAWSRWFFDKLDMAARQRRAGNYDLAHLHLRDARNFRKAAPDALAFCCERAPQFLEAAE